MNEVVIFSERVSDEVVVKVVLEKEPYRGQWGYTRETWEALQALHGEHEIEEDTDEPKT